ncbi:MAG: aspartate kinase, partial [Segetibacter sp.]
MQVLKFGGSSVANAENIEKVVGIIQQKSSEEKTIVVVSALGGMTDILLECGTLASLGDETFKEKLQIAEARHMETVKALVPVTQQSRILSYVKTQCNELEDICNGIFLLRELSAATKDRIVSYGELMSSHIIVAKLASSGIDAVWKDARELICTDNNHTNAAVDFALSNVKIATYFKESNHAVTVLPGFIAYDTNHKTTTLGRGGSDYTAAIVAAAVNAATLEIWTDVSGMMTADPRLVSTAKAIAHISYQEAMELSHFGAKVIYPPTIQPVMKKEIPVWIKNTFAPADEGTLIESTRTGNGKNIRGISSVNEIVLLSLEGSGMVGIPGFSKRLFEALANEKINVILITQGSSEHSICVGIDEKNARLAKRVIDASFSHEIETGKVEPLAVETGLSIIALVGDNMKNHPGISGKMFGALGRNGVDVRAIAQGSSERNISAVISRNDVKKAINVLHEEFFETTYKQLHLFVTGVGNVGSKLLAQIKQQSGYLQEHLRLQIKVAGIANSKNMLFNDDGINLSDWKDQLQQSSQMNIEEFIATIQSKNLRNAVFADVTANDGIA